MASAMAPAVRLRSAVALLGRFPALAGADLDVRAGEIVLLRGPNGAGKTSILRVCAGLLRVTGGEAEVLGHDLRTDALAVAHAVSVGQLSVVRATGTQPAGPEPYRAPAAPLAPENGQ